MSPSVYLFSELDAVEQAVTDWGEVRGLLGGKGANLADMTRLGIPVPPGFTVTTEACNAYLAAGNELPPDVWPAIERCLAAIEVETGQGFGSADAPLLLSCRSGARFSMPGMMDTVLNIGLNAEITEALAARTSPSFAYDLYRRLLHMFGAVVLGVPDEAFEEAIAAARSDAGVSSDRQLPPNAWIALVETYHAIVREHAGRDVPEDPREQLREAVEAVFRSWNGRRAIDYRNAAGIDHGLGTAVNVQTMVFGNLGDESATGVCMSRSSTTGEPGLEGDYLEQAQGEDVVAGTRHTDSIEVLADRMPPIHTELSEIAQRLETHHRNMQDIEFTVERGKLWILQTRDGKRTAEAEVRIAVDMVEEGLIDRETALLRVSPKQVEVFLHPRLDPSAEAGAELATGIAVAPGAAVGQAVFDADRAEEMAKDGQAVVLVRPDTKPDDVHGMLAARGIVTSRGGRTSHAALVARQFGRPAVVGASDLEIDPAGGTMTVGDQTIAEGDWLSIDGSTGRIWAGRLDTVTPDLENPWLMKLLSWADETRRLGVRANADYPHDAERARHNGAEGIGLCRTEHMFFETDRLPLVQAMIMAADEVEREAALAQLLPLQRADFEGLFRAMDGLPVIIRLIDPPLHEFLPDHDELVGELADLKVHIQHHRSLAEIDETLAQIRIKQRFLDREEMLHEENPMLGTRGVRLGMILPGLVRMQVCAIFEAACTCVAEGVDVRPEVMIPLVSHVAELRSVQATVTEEARRVMDERGIDVDYLFGTMIEIPRAALTAAEIAGIAEFFSFGTNDLTQTTFGISRDDAEQGFLVQYLRDGILSTNPFETIDPEGVGELMAIATERGRSTRPDLEVGICGEHGGDPASIALCERLGLDYVSCSPFRIPVARLAAAQAVLRL